ncbi:MAG: preprotein translocase subunit YajC [Candidatus Omnitrophica bacterium]|nr:preprotein translocase subunit YajC [Candidatus Omnitrophota bacterium]
MNTAQAGMMAQLFPLALIFLIFYFILIRPQQKQQKEFKKMLEALKKNDQIVTIGGVHGTIVNIKDKTLIVRVDDNTRLEIDKSAVSRLEKAGA